MTIVGGVAVCTCVHGTCDNGPQGSGRCRGNCFHGYSGLDCDREVKKCRWGTLVCHLHAECLVHSSGHLRCECKTGYEGDGQVCVAIDPCQKDFRGHCHPQAKCTKIGPGASHCDCDEGWHGDGFTCNPVIACNTSDHCHPNASCVDLPYQPGSYMCQCNAGYEVNGTDCQEINGCLVNNGGCHAVAACEATGPGTVNCTCPDNYVGDGVKCFTTIAGHILAHPNLTLVADLIKKQDPADVILADIGESFAFMAPSDQAMRQFMDDRVKDGYFDDKENIMTFFEFHCMARDYSLKEMMAVEGAGEVGRLATLYDGYSIRVFVNNKMVHVLSSQTTSARVVQADISALNGYLHIIDGVLEPFLPDADQPFLRDFFRLNTQYSIFGQWLERKGLMAQLQTMGPYTLFVMDNDIFRPDTINHTITSDYLKYYILPSIILTPSVDDKQTASTLLGDNHMLQFTTNGSQVSVNGVKILHSNLLTVMGVVHVISGLLHPVLNRCDRRTYKTAFGICGPCSAPDKLVCQHGYQPAKSKFVQRNRCRYTMFARLKFLGCRKLCETSISILQCCFGYYGPNCTECPGGPETPCGGRGTCDEGKKGSGHCLCLRPFSGPSCQDCVDSNMAGHYCNISKESCLYHNGNCSQNAECSHSESGDGVHCRCRLGYVGDGYTCTSPCDTQNGGCNVNATCSLQSENQTVICTCNQGFHGNGVQCEVNRNGCLVTEGPCSPYANCRYDPPLVTSENEGKTTCSCLPGYVGNGTLCVTTVLNALSQLSSTVALHQNLMTSMKVDNVTQLLGSDQSAVTVFIPVDVSSLEGLNINDYVVKDIVKLTPKMVEESNSTSGAIWASSGLALPLALQDAQYFVRGCRVIDRNIPAVNGYLHLLATTFSVQNPNVGGSSGSTTPGGLELVVILVPVAVLLLILLVVVVVVCYRRSHASGFLDFVRLFRKGSDASMSFARLKAQESEDDTQNPFSKPDNVNFHNPLYNDPQ